MEREIARARTDLAGTRLASPVSVLALFGTPTSYYAFTERTWLGDLLARLGYENVVPAPDRPGRLSGLVPLTDEVVEAAFAARRWMT